MSSVAGVLCAFFLTSIYIVQCNARHGMDHGQWAKPKSILCYECNSKYDPRCADPFDPYTIGIVNCSKKRPLDHMPEEKPILCRKTVQKVQGNIRVIRGCGYLQSKYDGNPECMVRSGTHDVNIRYCSCKDSTCNTADTQFYPSSYAVATVALSVIAKLMNF